MSFYTNRPRRRAGSIALFSLTLLTFAGLAVLPTGYVIERPGQSFNVMGEVDGEPVIASEDVKTYQSDSKFDVLTVSLIGNRDFTPNWIQVLSAWADSEQVVLPLDEVYPPQLSQEEIKAESSLQMEISQQDAIAAALRNLGYQVPSQLYVNSVIADAPSSGILIAGDFVKAIDSVQVKNFDELRARIQKSEGNPIVMSVVRDGKALDLEITPERNEDLWVVGAMVGTTYDFPVDIKLQLGDVGGPSGGLMFTLGIIDSLTPGSLGADKHLAGTGTISPDGAVGPIGGIELKMIAAKRSGADLFIGPFANCSEIQGKIPQGLEVVAVRDLSEALTAVEAVSKGQDLPNLSCNR